MIPISPITVKVGVVNGDFSLQPALVAPTTSVGVFIDGTATGSLTNNQYAWGVRAGGSGASANFDNTDGNSLKLSGVANVLLEISYYASGSITSLSKSLIPVLPNTLYKYSFTMKTNYVSGDATNGAYMIFKERNAAGSNTVSTLSTTVKTTTGKTKYEGTFTTGATTVWLDPTPRIDGAGGSASLVMTANFYSFSFTTVSSITNSSSSPVLFYTSLTANSSTDNIDQSNTSTTLSSGTVRKIAQSFVPTKKNLTGIVFRKGTTTITGDVTVSIQSDTAGSPSGTPIVSSTILNSAFNAINGNNTVNLLSTLTVGSTYWIVISLNSGTNQQTNITREADASGGTAKYDASGSWTAWNLDIYHQTLYAKNTTNLTVSTDTQTVSVTAPTTDGFYGGAVIDTVGNYSFTQSLLDTGNGSLSKLGNMFRYSISGTIVTSQANNIIAQTGPSTNQDYAVYKVCTPYPVSTVTLTTAFYQNNTLNHFVDVSRDDSTYINLRNVAGTANVTNQIDTTTYLSGLNIFYVRIRKGTLNDYFSLRGLTIAATMDTSSVTPLTLASGANAIYVASNGPATADGTVDPSLQGIFGGKYITAPGFSSPLPTFFY